MVHYVFYIHFFFTLQIHSQNSNPAEYFPLNIGNVWVYTGYYSTIMCMNSNFIVRVKVDSSKVSSGKTYYSMGVTIRLLSGPGCTYSHFANLGFYRVDSVSGNIYNLTSNPTCAFSPNEKIMDSLRSKLSDTLYICGQSSDPKRVLTDTLNAMILGSSRPIKQFVGGNFHELSTRTKYAKGIGVIDAGMGGMSLNMHNTLRGCLINGVIYGDTSYTLVDISQISSEIPGNFQLKQNYPNPFNPTTQISFDIPTVSFVEIIIYDASGKEIEKLVNDELTAGSYSADWNASAYPSGVYFYKITAGEFRETKKMVLVK